MLCSLHVYRSDTTAFSFFLSAEDVHMQGNPAYEPITSALVEAHPLQLSTGEELCESNTGTVDSTQ